MAKGNTTRRWATAALGGWLLLVHTAGSGAPPGEAAARPATGATVNFSFDQVDVRTFVKLIGEMTGRSFVIDEAVKGQITVVAPRVPLADVYPLFGAILESVGCAVVDESPIPRIVAMPSRALPAAPVVGSGATLPRTGVITRVVSLQHTSVAELRKVIEALAGREKGGTIIPVEATNHLIVTDTAESIRRIEQILQELDRPGRGWSSEVVVLQHLDAAEFAQQYQAAGTQRAGRDPAGQRPGKDLILLAVPRSNSLVLLGAPAEIAEVRRILKQVDVDPGTGLGNLHAIFLRYIAADEAAKSLTALLDKSMGKDAPKTGDRRRLAIEASTANNALLVDAAPAEFKLVQDLVAELDQMPQQVMIEVVIAELDLTDGLDVGVEMVSLKMPSEVGSTEIQGSSLLSSTADSLMNNIQNGLFPRGITVGAAYGTSVDSEGKVVPSYPLLFNLNALQEKGKVKILSSVPLLAQNNKEASVNVVNNIPILKSTIQGGSGTSRDVIQNIDRMDVGIKLKLTPHINPSNEVCMVLNPSIEAIIDEGSAGTAFTPTIAKREVMTTVTVPSGRTIVISGLIREDRRDMVRRVPILGALPILGVLFRHTQKVVERTNLIVFVTPRVVTAAEAAQAVTDQWGRRTGLSTESVMEAISSPTPAGRR